MRLPCLNGHFTREPSKPGRKDFPERYRKSAVMSKPFGSMALSTLLDTRYVEGVNDHNILDSLFT